MEQADKDTINPTLIEARKQPLGYPNMGPEKLRRVAEQKSIHEIVGNTIIQHDDTIEILLTEIVAIKARLMVLEAYHS